jgi:lipopolysaccharide/colanic/teichoic acid biosynthesis glycosyltransferase
MPRPEHSQAWFMAKRCYDLFFSALGLLLLSPVLLGLAVLVRLCDSAPVFYRQKRVGQHGRPFEIWKFRTMLPGADRLGPAITKTGDSRVTRLGRFLRAAKLDELPQLWNVFLGDMSLVGPRPEVPRYVALYTAEQRQILAYKPGITDLATLRFRNEELLLRQAQNIERFYRKVCIPRKLAMNFEYLRQSTVLTDTGIILRTLFPSWVGMLLLHTAVLAASLWFSFFLDARFRISAFDTTRFGQAILWIPPIQLALLAQYRQFSALRAFFSLPDLRQLLIALAWAFLIAAGAWATLFRSPHFGILCIDYLLANWLLIFINLRLRAGLEKQLPKRRGNLPDCRVGIMGAGSLGANVALRIAGLQSPGIKIVGFFDDDACKWKKQLHGIPVLGMPELILEGWRKCLDHVLVAMPEAAPGRLREIHDILKKSGLKFDSIPSMAQLLCPILRSEQNPPLPHDSATNYVKVGKPQHGKTRRAVKQ